MAKVLMKGNEAVGKAAIEAGCRYFFGYPITPQSEVPEYLSNELPKVGGTFVQAKSEVAAINMVYGAAAAGARVLTSSSSPGIALKQEGIGYISNASLPAVIINMMRGGPGLGTIQPGQADYNQSVKGGSNGDYHDVVLAPASVQSVTMQAERACKVIVDADQLSLAIGKEGQNARLAARLTGFKIDIKID
jgi:2-oxoglutarate ferredoxin oxidoreductase subunit alpha